MSPLRLIAFTLVAGVVWAGPAIVLEPAEIDLGPLWQGQLANATLTLRNVGDASLVIERVQTGCGCTAAALSTREVAPGAATPIELRFDSTRKGPGPVAVSVRVMSNDPEQPTATARLRAEVRPVLAYAPPDALHQRTQAVGERVTLSGKLQVLYDAPLALRLASGRAGIFDVRLKPVTPGREYELIATSREPVAAGVQAATVILMTDQPKLPQVEVPLRLAVEPRVQALPALLYVPKRPTATLQRVRVVYRGDDPEFRVTGVELNADNLSATLADSGRLAGGQRQNPVIEVQIPADSELGVDVAELVIETNDPDYATIVVQLTSDGDRYRAMTLAGLGVATGKSPVAGQAGSNPSQP